MKPFAQFNLVFLALTLLCRAAAPSAAIEKEVLRAEEEWKTAVLNGDRAGLEKLLSVDLSYTHSSSKTQSKGEFIQDATGGATTYKSIEFEAGTLRQYGGNVVVITHAVTVITVQTGSSHLYITEVWANQQGHWQMASRQATKLPQ